MFKLNYRQIFNFSLPKALIKYKDNEWFREKLFIWTGPPVTRDTVCLLFVVSFCFVKHSSSHFLLLYVIISLSIYYYWVRFQQLKYTEPLHGKLQTVFDLSFDIRYLSALVPRSTFFAGFFAYICTIGVYLFYAVKSILVMSEPTSLSSGPWIESAKTSSAGFFPVSMTALIHLQCLIDPKEYQTKLGIAQNSMNFGKYFSFAYIFDNRGAAPFFGKFTNDLELLTLLENFSFEKFSLFQFFIFTYRTAFRLWIPLFSGGYQNFLVWWIHPYSEVSFINILGQPRYIFEPFIIAVSLVLEDSIQQIYASFYMDRWVFPLYAILNQPGFPFGLFQATNEAIGPLVSGLSFGQSEALVSIGPTPTKFSKFILTSLGYLLKYAPIYVPCEQARFRATHRFAEIIFSPFILGFQLFVFLFKIFIFIWVVGSLWAYDLLREVFSFFIINCQNLVSGFFIFNANWSKINILGNPSVPFMKGLPLFQTSQLCFSSASIYASWYLQNFRNFFLVYSLKEFLMVLSFHLKWISSLRWFPLIFYWSLSFFHPETAFSWIWIGLNPAFILNPF